MPFNCANFGEIITICSIGLWPENKFQPNPAPAPDGFEKVKSGASLPVPTLPPNPGYAAEIQMPYRNKSIMMVINVNKKLSYCWETVRRESMPRIAEMDVEMTT